MGLKSIPEAAQEEIYQFIQLALTPEQMITGLAEDYRQTSDALADSDCNLEDFVSLLNEMSPTALSDVFYETAISNDRYDSHERSFYIDRNCTTGYRTDELLGVFFKQALARIASVEQLPVSDKSLISLMNQAREAIVSGKIRTTLFMGPLAIEIQPAKGAVKLVNSLGELTVDEIDKRSLGAALKQWHHRIKGLDINVTNDEAYAP